MTEEERTLENDEGKIDIVITRLDRSIRLYRILAWGFILGGLTLGAIGVISYFCYNDQKGFALNLLGDFLSGTVASLWGLAGLFLIYISFLGQKQQILQQQIEILYSREEIRLNRLELKGQREEMSKQNSTLQRQMFENSFFHLFNNLRELLINLGPLILPGERDVHQGNKVTIELLQYFKYLVHSYKHKTSCSTSDAVFYVYENHFWSIAGAHIDYYFYSIFFTIKFIDDSQNISELDKKDFVSLIRTTLSSHAQALLFFHSLTIYGEHFKPYIIKYALFKSIKEELIYNKELVEEYPKEAFF